MSSARHFTISHILGAILLLGFFWATVFFVYHVVLPAFGIPLTYTGNPLLTTAYFFAWCALLLAFYPRTLIRAHLSQDLDAYVLLLVFFAFLALFYGGIVPLFHAHNATSYPLNHFTNPGISFFLPKLAEILLQQGIVIALVLLLASYRDSLLFVSTALLFTFGITHAFLLFDVGLQFSLIFGIASLFASIVFPYLILRVRNGIVYSYMLHWAFYIGLTLWFMW